MKKFRPSSFLMTTRQLSAYLNKYIIYAVLLFIAIIILFVGDW